MQPLPHSLDNRRRGIVGTTWVSTRREYQFFIAAPKTVPIAYQHSGFKMQQTYFLLTCEHDVELFEQRKPQHQIVHNGFYRYGPIIWTEWRPLNFRFRSHDQSEY